MLLSLPPSLSRSLEAFAAQPGKAAVFRETSAQHFKATTGDYHDAVRKDPSLVLAPAPQPQQQPPQQWTGPSMCQRIAETEPPNWRNEALGNLFRRHRYRHVTLQPFEALTRPRWDFHSSTKLGGDGEWRSDCTHFCYSPCFWEESFEDLASALRQSLYAERGGEV